MAELTLPPTGSVIHVVGVGGAGMSGVAKILAQLGYRVSGSDLKPGRTLELLADVGVEAWVGHRPDRATSWDVVVASSAVPDRDPELRAAADAGVPVWRRPRLLGALTARFPTVGLAGTHGKTTSTALMVTALRGMGHDPSFIVGGELVALNTGAHRGSDDLFVLEADEAFGTFRHLHLSGMMVTNVEPDHLDHYGSVTALEDAFAQVAADVSGPVVACIDDPGVRRLDQRVPVVSYGTRPDATWRIVDVAPAGLGVRFGLRHRAGGSGDGIVVEVPRPGMHVARNAAGVLALLGEMGYDVPAAAASMAAFDGVRRRWEVRAKVGGVIVVEDYAHHPTEIAATVQAAITGARGRVWAVFQPHRYTRTADLGPEFGRPLSEVHETIVTDVYPAGEHPIPGVTGKIVADAVAAAGGQVRYVPRLGDVVDLVVAGLQPGDVLLLLGAGDVGSIADRVALGLEQR